MFVDIWRSKNGNVLASCLLIDNCSIPPNLLVFLLSIIKQRLIMIGSECFLLKKIFCYIQIDLSNKTGDYSLNVFFFSPHLLSNLQSLTSQFYCIDVSSAKHAENEKRIETRRK